MSRIAKIPVAAAQGRGDAGKGEITVKGPLGTLTRKFGDTYVEKAGDTLVFKAANEERSAMSGTLRALVANMVKGVTEASRRS